MKHRKIHIENLKVRLPNSCASNAKQIAAGLGNEILSQTAETTRLKVGKQRIDHLNIGRVKIRKGESGSGLRKQIAQTIAGLIGERIK